MANYYGMTRTNYFRVTDPERLKKIIENTCTDEDSLKLWTLEDDGRTLYGFGCYGSIVGLAPSFYQGEEGYDEDDPDFESFVEELQDIVASDDAIIITEIGNEKLRYLTAYSVIITAKESYISELRTDSIKAAQNMLCNPNWKTRMEY